MNDNDSLPIPSTASNQSSPSSTPPLLGARYSTSSQPSNPTKPDISEDHGFTTSDTVDKESQKSLGPSAFEGTDSPYLAKVFDINTTEIRQLELREPLALVDSYILSLVKERNWVDNADSYNRVLSELKVNLGIDQSLQPLLALERLSKGVSLLKLQKMHRRRDAQIQREISRINKINT